MLVTTNDRYNKKTIITVKYQLNLHACLQDVMHTNSGVSQTELISSTKTTLLYILDLKYLFFHGHLVQLVRLCPSQLDQVALGKSTNGG